MSLIVYDPHTKRFEKEQVAGEGILKVLYGTAPGTLLLNGLIKRKAVQLFAGAYCDSPFSVSRIKPFIEDYGIPMAEAVIPPGGFRTFNEFFTRALRPGARPLPAKGCHLVSPADARVRVATDLAIDAALQAKGHPYHLAELLGDASLAEPFEGGTLFTLRLNPTDYHRFHYPISCMDLGSAHFPGAYYSVNPLALQRIPELYLKNKRVVTYLRHPSLGPIALVQVGATSVGSIHHRRGAGPARIGEEKGYFAFGGSTLLVLTPPSPGWAIREDLLLLSAKGLEVRLRQGESLMEDLLARSPLDEETTDQASKKA
ncbi:Phosphatidylserine decarboxylase [Clostridiaceae bacterium JG1575]|nr:Phosphatidylserine decarboxylase [Clostridiaceae bacterium JG1575]